MNQQRPLGIGRGLIRRRGPKAHLRKKPVSEARLRQAMRNLGETKFYSAQLTNLGSTAGTISHLTTISQGVANGQRDGLVIQNKALRFRYSVQSTSASAQLVRVIIFKWMDRYDSVPTVADILKQDAAGPSNTTMSAYNLVFKDKFKILHDRTYDLDGFAVGVMSTNTLYHCNVRKTLKGTIKYVDDLSGHYEKGSIHCLVISSNAASIVPDFTYQYLYKDN